MNSEWPGELEFRLWAQMTDAHGGVRCLGYGPYDSHLLIELYRTTAGKWSWWWSEKWLGHETISDPRMHWLHREHAVEALARMAYFYRVSGLAAHFLTWR